MQFSGIFHAFFKRPYEKLFCYVAMTLPSTRPSLTINANTFYIQPSYEVELRGLNHLNTFGESIQTVCTYGLYV